MKSIYFFLIMGSLFSCSEIISPDLREITPVLFSPPDSLHSSETQFQFYWEPDPLAKAYHFQLVRPDFNQPLLQIDSVLSHHSLSLTLAEGVYSWRIRFQNNGGYSPYISRPLVVDLSPPSQAQAIYPLQGAHLQFGQDSLKLHWSGKDQALDGQIFPSSDSVFVYTLSNAQIHERGRFFVPEGSPKILDLQDLIESFPKDDSLEFCWRIHSFDRAGNRSISLEFTFILK